MGATQDSRKIVVGLGELLWDCFPDSRRPGGAPANVAYHAAQLGANGVVCSRVGQDADGDELLAYLRQHGLATACVQQDAAHPTGTVTVHTDRADSPSYTIHEDVAWDYLTLDDTWRGVLSQAAAICFGTLAQREPASRATIREALALGRAALRVYDVNLRPPFFERALVEGSLQHADVVKLNDQEVPTLGDLLGLPAETPAAFAAAMLARFACRFVCVTRGARGCVLVAESEAPVEVPGQRVTVADTVGAGDAFTAGLTFGLIEEWPLHVTATFANRVGGLVASRPGAMPAVSDEYEALKAALA